MSETSGDVPSAAQVIHLEDANAPEDDDRRYVAAKSALVVPKLTWVRCVCVRARSIRLSIAFRSTS